jgi:hypothetical protein
MVRSAYIVCILLLGVFFSACTPNVQVSSEPATGFHLSDYKTFDFFEVDASGDGLGDAYQSQVAYIQEEIVRQLESRGLTRTTTEPDLLVNLGVVVEEQVQTRETNLRSDPPNYIGQRRYTWRAREVEVGRYREGTVSVHLVDSDRNELVWHGTAEAILAGKPEKLQKQISEGMQELISQVPQ